MIKDQQMWFLVLFLKTNVTIYNSSITFKWTQILLILGNFQKSLNLLIYRIHIVQSLSTSFKSNKLYYWFVGTTE